MKKIICLCVVVLLFNLSYSQITKGNWLVGGSASFSNTDYGSGASTQYKRTDLQISPSIGYFVADKLAFGLSPSIVYGKAILPTNTGSSTVFNIGPFARYYLLQADKPFNLFAEGNYAYGAISGGDGQHTYSIEAGPVLYFNSSVGLEFTFGYSSTKYVGYSGHDNVLQFGIGFQIHLEK